MTPPRQEWALDTRRLGRRVLVYDRLDSTNNLAAALAEDPANDGVVVLADEQTAGRGQYGRTWLAPPGDPDGLGGGGGLQRGPAAHRRAGED